MRMYGRRRKLTAEETEANRVAKLAREAATMTCQCCGHKHLANRGWIAHHAYQRPGEGWQTASCMGAKALPFEVDRAQLGKMIDQMNDRKRRRQEVLSMVANEQMVITLTYSFVDYRSSDRVERNVKFYVTRANWDEVVAAEDNQELFDNKYGRWESFDKVKQMDLEYRCHEISGITNYINEQTKRYNGWKQTHRWEASTETWEGV